MRGLASLPFIFFFHDTSVCLTYSNFHSVVSPTGSRPPSRNWNNEMPGDEELGFEAAVAALGEYVSTLSICELHLAQTVKGIRCWPCSKGALWSWESQDGDV